MNKYIEIIKDISAILGVIMSLSAVLSLLSKNVRGFFKRLFNKYGKTDEVAVSISEMKALLENHMEDSKEFKKQFADMNSISIEFMKNQSRNTIKDIFYTYQDTKVLPLYVKKTLMTIEDLYLNKLHGNSFAKLLLEEMRTWDVDYEASHPGEQEDEHHPNVPV